MAEDDAEIIVSLETEGEITKVEPARDEAGKFVAKEPVEPAEDLAAQFKAEAESARERAAAAEQRERNERQAREAAERREQEANTKASDSQYGNVESGIAAAQAEAETAKRDYRAASEAGDFDKQTEAIERLSAAKAKMLRLDEAKSDLETRRAEKPAERTEPKKPQADDPVEAYIANRTEPTAKWLREHREYIIDPKKNARLTAAHHNAIADGLSPDTDAYFESVEKFVGLKKAEPEAKTNGQQAPAKRRSTVPVAPVQQSGGSAGGSGGTEVRLSAGEARAATDGMTHVWGPHDLKAGRIKEASLVGTAIGVQEMARRKYAMQKKGLYDKVFEQQ